MPAAPLTRCYGWEAHDDVDGKLALIGPGSPGDAALALAADLPSKPAMRSKQD